MENTNRKNAMQLILMITLTCLSQILSLYKSRFTAVSFGATNYMDAYNFALNIGMFVFAFITTGVTTVIIPAYVNKTDKKAIDSFITIIYSSIIIVIAIALFFRYPLVNLLTNRGIDFVNLVSDFLIIAFISQGVTAFLAVTTGYYQSINHYTIPKTIALVSNVIITIVLLSGWITNIYTYLSLLVLGAMINLILDVSVAIKSGFRYIPRLNFKNPSLRNMLLVFAPTLFSSGVYKIHTMVDITIATNLVEGQVTILSYATQIITMVNNVIVGNLTVYAYPKIIARMKEKGEKKYFWDYAIFFHAAVLLLIAGFINIGNEGVKLIFLGGRFTSSDVHSLYVFTCIYIFGQQFNIVRDLIYRYFYAKGNTKETLKNSILVSAANIILSLILVQFLGVIGIILGTVLSSLLSLLMITYRFKKEYGFGVKIIEKLLECGKNIIAMCAAVFVVYLLKMFLNLPWIIVQITVYGVITVVVYGAVLIALNTRIKHIQF